MGVKSTNANGNTSESKSPSQHTSQNDTIDKPNFRVLRTFKYLGATTAGDNKMILQ